jgi:hypothetical protein
MSCVDHNSIIIAELRAIFSGLNNRKEISSKRILIIFTSIKMKRNFWDPLGSGV